ncbi:phage/plasmid primase, P4 family [bacterium]|nr:phage/plasmid primase, P4 family [bacterium]
MDEPKNISLDIAQKLQEGFELYTIYDQIHKKDGSLYKPLKNNRIIKLILEACIAELREDKISKNIINDILFYLNALEIIPEESINPEDSFSFKNGELVIENGNVLLRDHQSVFTFQSDIPADLNASTDDINCFLDDILGSEKDKMQILESLAVGMFPVLRHRVNFDSFILAFGTGANGKSVLFESIVKPVFSMNAMASVPIEQMNKRFFLANLVGKRLNIATENASHYIAENRQVKALTSGDTQTVERKHMQPFEANIFCSLFYSINKEPTIADISYAMKRRLRLISFPYRFTDNPAGNEKKADSSLKDSSSPKAKRLQQGLIVLLKNTAERLWQEKKMTPNDQKTIAELQEQSSHHRQFVTEYLEFDAYSEIESLELFNLYVSFCENEHIAEKNDKGNVRWTDPDRYDSATKGQNKLTKRLVSLYPSQITKSRNSQRRTVKGIRIKNKVFSTVTTVTNDASDATNQLTFPRKEQT